MAAAASAVATSSSNRRRNSSSESSGSNHTKYLPIQDAAHTKMQHKDSSLDFIQEVTAAHQRRQLVQRWESQHCSSRNSDAQQQQQQQSNAAAEAPRRNRGCRREDGTLDLDVRGTEGTIVAIRRERGFRFLRPDAWRVGGRDIYFHVYRCNTRYDDLQVYDRVTYIVSVRKNEPTATQVERKYPPDCGEGLRHELRPRYHPSDDAEMIFPRTPSLQSQPPGPPPMADLPSHALEQPPPPPQRPPPRFKALPPPPQRPPPRFEDPKGPPPTRPKSPPLCLGPPALLHWISAPPRSVPTRPPQQQSTDPCTKIEPEISAQPKAPPPPAVPFSQARLTENERRQIYQDVRAADRQRLREELHAAIERFIGPS